MTAMTSAQQGHRDLIVSRNSFSQVLYLCWMTHCPIHTRKSRELYPCRHLASRSTTQAQEHSIVSLWLWLLLLDVEWKRFFTNFRGSMLFGECAFEWNYFEEEADIYSGAKTGHSYSLTCRVTCGITATIQLPQPNPLFCYWKIVNDNAEECAVHPNPS